MTVTIVRKVFLHDVDLVLPDNPTQRDVDEAIRDYYKYPEDFDWDEKDGFGNLHMDVYDNYTGCKIFSTDD